MKDINKRIEGYDLARAIAIIGMIIVNFKVVFNAYSGNRWLVGFAELFDGKAAATFVMLAGIGISLMSANARRHGDINRLNEIRKVLGKRALFLFIVGLLYIAIWPADILHYYGIYLLGGLLFLNSKNHMLILVAGLLIFIYPFLLGIYEYDTGWDWATISYMDFWSVEGFIRNLLLNGFHPAIPWLAFLLIGMHVGRIDLRNARTRNRIMLFSLMAFILIKGVSIWLVNWSVDENPWIPKEEIVAAFGTNPMPPLPFYMLSGISIVLFVISLSVFIAERWAHTLAIRALIYTGQMALNIYILHVILGMGIIFLFLGEEVSLSISYAMIHALVFSFVSIVFSYKWRLKYDRGPLEMLMRKITG